MTEPSDQRDSRIATAAARLRLLKAEAEEVADTLAKHGPIKAFFNASRGREKNFRYDAQSIQMALDEITSPGLADNIVGRLRLRSIRSFFNFSADCDQDLFDDTRNAEVSRTFARKLDDIIALVK